MSSPIRPPLWITETDGNPSGRPINKIVVSNGTLSISGTTATITTNSGGGGGSGTVTNVSSTDSFISITNPNTTPSITIQNATTSQDGILTSTDWNTFNNKTGNLGTVTSVSSTDSFVSVASGTTTPNITIGSATGSVTGVLTSTDWTTFNNKQDALTLTTTGSSGAATLVGSTLNIPQYSGGGGGGTIGGSIANTQVAVGSGTDTISGSNSLLFDGTSLTVNTGSNDPILNLTNSTKSVTLKVATSQKLTIQGSADTFVFDASSSTGGITFPDGTTQTTAASGGGGSGTVTVGTNAGNNNLAYFSGATEISNTNNISINAPTGSADFFGSVEAGNVKIGTNTNKNTVETSSAQDLILRTNAGTNSGTLSLANGVNGNMTLTPNGTGEVHLGNFKFDVDQAVGAGQDNYVLTYDNSTDSISLEAAGGGGGGISGSGTVGKIPVFVTDTTTIGDSRISQGTTSVRVTGTGGASFELQATDGNEPSFQLLTSASAGLRLELTDANTVTLKKIGTNTNRWRSSGTAFSIYDNTGSLNEIFSATYSTKGIKISNAYTLPTAVTGVNDYILTAQTDGSTAWAAAPAASVSFPLRAPDDSASAPSYSFTNAATSGLFRLTATTVGISAGGSAAMYFQSTKVEANKNFEVLAGSEAAPSLSFAGDGDTGLYLDTSSGSNGVGIAKDGVSFMSIGYLNGIEVKKKITAAAGSATNPAYGFSNDGKDNGFYRAAVDTIAVANNGSETWRFGAAGQLGVQGANYGASGQVLTSGGASAAPSWATADKRNYQGLLSPISTSSKTWDITRQTPFSTGSNAASQFGSMFNNTAIAFCFAAPQSGVPTEVAVTFGSGSSGGINFAFYNSNSDGAPNQLIAEGSATYSSNATVFDTSLTGQSGGSAGEMTVGELMWCVMTRTDGGVATVMSCSVSGSRGKTATSTTLNTAGNCLETSSFNASTSFTNTAPSITSWNAQNTLIPIIGVRF